jgi:hypothetical protein
MSRAWDESAGIGQQAWRAVGWLALRSLVMAGAGVAAVTLAGIILDTKAFASWDLLIGAVIAGGLIAMLGGLGGLFHVARMGLCLLRWPWASRPARFKELTIPIINGEQPCLVLGERGEDVLSVPTWRWRWRVLASYDRAEIWFCGRAGGSGAVFLPAEGRTLWARRILIPALRMAFRRRVLGVRGSDR